MDEKTSLELEKDLKKNRDKMVTKGKKQELYVMQMHIFIIFLTL